METSHQLLQIASDVKEMKDALIGNSTFGTKGMRHDITDIKKEQMLQQMEINGNRRELEGKHGELEKRITEVENANFKKGVVIATASAGIGAVTGATGWSLLKAFFMKIFFLGLWK